MDQIKIGKFIAELRKEKKLSQAETWHKAWCNKQDNFSMGER